MEKLNNIIKQIEEALEENNKKNSSWPDWRAAKEEGLLKAKEIILEDLKPEELNLSMTEKDYIAEGLGTISRLHPDNISNNDSTEKFSKSNLEEFIKDYSLHALESKIPKNTREFYIWMKATMTAMTALSHFIKE